MFDEFVHFKNSGLSIDPKKTEGFLIDCDSVMFYMASGENIALTNEDDIRHFKRDVLKIKPPFYKEVSSEALLNIYETDVMVERGQYPSIPRKRRRAEILRRMDA